LHEHTDLLCLTEILEGMLPWLNPNGPTITLGFQFENIWDGTKTPKVFLPSARSAPSTKATPSAQPKCQIVKAIHVEVAKEHEGIVVNLIYKALCSTAFRCMTNFMMKLVPIFSVLLPSMQQDILCHTITKQVQCIVEFEYMSKTPTLTYLMTPLWP